MSLTARPSRWFYVGAASFVIVVSAVGFGPSLVDHSRRTLPPTTLVVAHGVLTGAWLVLFLVQASLIAVRRTAVHQRLGLLGLLLTLAIILTGVLTVIEGARRGYDLSGDLERAATPPGSPPPTREEFVVGVFAPLLGFIGFGALAAAGLWYRRKPGIHKRVMLFALLTLTFVPLLHLSGYLIAHWPGMYGSLSIGVPLTANLLIFAGAVHDKLTVGRIHPVSLWLPLLWIGGTALLLAVVPQSAAWRQFSLWLVGT